MNLEKLKQAIEITKLLDGECALDSCPVKVGDKVFIRTVTLYYTGKIKALANGFITLDDAAWIADTGRFHDFLKEGKANEVEPFIDPVHIPVSSVIDMTEWKHPLLKEQK